MGMCVFWKGGEGRLKIKAELQWVGMGFALLPCERRRDRLSQSSSDMLCPKPPRQSYLSTASNILVKRKQACGMGEPLSVTVSTIQHKWVTKIKYMSFLRISNMSLHSSVYLDNQKFGQRKYRKTRLMNRKMKKWAMSNIKIMKVSRFMGFKRLVHVLFPMIQTDSEWSIYYEETHYRDNSTYIQTNMWLNPKTWQALQLGRENDLNKEHIIPEHSLTE